MILNFMKKPYIFALFLSVFILPLTTITTLLSFYPKIIVALLIFTIGSYIYTRIFQFKFSNAFLMKTLLWHFIYIVILPTLVITLFLGTETIGKLIEIFVQSKANSWIVIVVTLMVLLACYLALYLACWLGNKIGMKYPIIGEKSVKKFISSRFGFSKPFTFAIVFFLLLLCTKDVFILLFELIKLKIPNIVIGLLAIFFIPVCAGLFSFVYTHFYRHPLSKKFKVRAIAIMSIMLFITFLIHILRNPILKSNFLGDGPTDIAVIRFIVSSIMSLTIWIVICITYFCITYGNKVALKHFKNDEIEAS